MKTPYLANLLTAFMALPVLANFSSFGPRADAEESYEATAEFESESDSELEELFDLEPTTKIFTSKVDVAAELSAAELDELLCNFVMSPNGYVHIRMYMGKHGSTKFPKHAFGVNKEFLTVTWFKDGEIKEWDAFIFSSGYPHDDGGDWSPSGNFSILEVYGKNKKSSLYPKRKKGKSGGAKMPYAMEVDGGIRMHVGAADGHPKSHGCFRLPKEKGRFLNQIVRKIGKENVLVTAYRNKATLDENERRADEINARLKKPMSEEFLNFFGFVKPVKPAVAAKKTPTKKTPAKSTPTKKTATKASPIPVAVPVKKSTTQGARRSR